MRITESQLRRIIRQEVRSLRSGRPLREAAGGYGGGHLTAAGIIDDLIARMPTSALPLVDQVSDMIAGGADTRDVLFKVMQVLRVIKAHEEDPEIDVLMAELKGASPAQLSSIFSQVLAFEPV